MTSRSLKIGADTMIPVASLAVIATIVWGGAMVYFKTDANAQTVEAHEAKLKQVDDIQTDVAVIKSEVMGIKSQIADIAKAQQSQFEIIAKETRDHLYVIEKMKREKLDSEIYNQ